MTARRWIEAPLAWQIAALLVGGIVVGQAMAFGVVLFLPPPPPALYRVEDIAAALRGGSLDSRFGRPLTRMVAERAPAMATAAEGRDVWIREVLARRLRVARDDLRLDIQHDPRAVFGPGRGPGPADAGGRRTFPIGPVTTALPEPWGLGAPIDRGAPMTPPIVGNFTAALRRPSGGWVIVRPASEPFPNPWQQRVMLWFLGCLIVLGPGGYIFARRLSAPLAAFARAADRLGRDPSGPLITLRGPAEIGAAAVAFNEMQIRLKRYVDNRTTMIGAISHDLRMPLMRVRFKIERAEPQTRGSILPDILQMQEMIGAVLAFVRDASLPSDRSRVDLFSVVDDIVAQAREMDADIEITGDETLVVDADLLALQRLFANIIDNALKYGARALVDLTREGGDAVVRISDDGPGLSAADLDRVFEPFYRVRSTGGAEAAGVGLGLAVARSVARDHGGDVELTNTGRGLLATVRLPLSSSR